MPQRTGRIAIVAAQLLLMVGTAAQAQTRLLVDGRIVETGSGRAIANASVELDGHPAVLAGDSGTFRFEQVAPGGYALRVAALGYATRDFFVVLRRDTTLLVTLDPAPLPLDTLAVRNRTVNIRGEVRALDSDRTLHRAEVLTNLNRDTRTNVAGRFRLREIPADYPVVVGVRVFGYLPFDTTVVTAADTTLRFELRVDSLVQRMIDVEVARLEKRANPYRTAIMPALDREELLRHRGTVLDALKSEYSIFLRRVRCILIDERQSYNGLEELDLYLPDELERIEVLERGAMLRIYTRDFIRTMLGGGIQLGRPVYVPYGRPPMCR